MTRRFILTKYLTSAPAHARSYLAKYAVSVCTRHLFAPIKTLLSLVLHKKCSTCSTRHRYHTRCSAR